MSTLQQKPIIIGAVLIIAAMMYSRKATAGTVKQASRPPGYGSVPGTAGTGTNQIVGGILGSISKMFNTGQNKLTDTGIPVTTGGVNDQYLQDFRRQEILQENATAPDQTWQNAFDQNQELADNVAAYGV